MSRLSDRAFQIIKTEIDRCYSDSPDDQLERVIMLARLETLKQQTGDPISKVQLWETFSDISPKFDQKVLQTAANLDNTSPIFGASFGIGAVAVLVAAAMGVEQLNTDLNPETATTNEPSAQNAASKGTFTTQLAKNTTATPVPPKASPTATPKFASQTTAATQVVSSANKDAFETAKAFGWQAALKSQNPPHSAQYWKETATLWTQAIELLEQVPKHSHNYTAAQAKRAVYQQNLETIQALEQEANTAVSKDQAAPKFSAPQPNNQQDHLTIAKSYGWQAAVASQNAPHPVQKWADISKLWQLAIQTIDQIDAQDPLYPEAQQVRAQYQENLVAIRQRYQQEQNATQRLQSLQATLTEIEQSITLSNSSRKAQLNAIISRLQTIPESTVAHLQAQSLIERTQIQLGSIPATPSARLAVSTETVR